MLPRPFDSLRRILAVRLDNIGDVVMTGPALRELRRAYPAARITLMASQAGSQAAPLLPWVDEVITWRASWQDIAPSPAMDVEKEYELVRLLAGQQFDALFIFTSFSQSPHPPAYAGYLAKIPLRVGQSKEFGGALLSHWVKPLPDAVYQVQRNLHLLREVGIPVIDDRLELQVRPEDQASTAAVLANNSIDPQRPLLALAPGASAAARRYDEQRFAEAARLLAYETGAEILLIGSAREAGKFPALEALASHHPRVHSLIGKTSVTEMADVIRRSALLIGNNSSAMHIAAAFNRPMVILFSGTELEEQWRPDTANVHFLNRPTHCTPCHGFQCPYQMECLDVPAEEVYTAAVRMLKAGPSAVPDRENSLLNSYRR